MAVFLINFLMCLLTDREHSKFFHPLHDWDQNLFEDLNSFLS